MNTEVKTTWHAEYFDTDTESWEFMDDVQPSSDKQQVQDEARYQANKCAYYVRTRVVES